LHDGDGGVNSPRLSIGLPVYNGERYLSEALNSLLAQTFEDFELIVCDNASTDRTEAICRTYAVRDRRVRYHRNPTNLGAARNYRLTFAMSAAPYFRWATYDDLVAPELLARCVEVLDRDESVVLAYPKTKLLDEEGGVISESEYEDGLHLTSPRASERFIKLIRRLGLCNAVYGLIRASELRKTALLGSYVGSDGPLLAELTLYGKFFEIPEYLFYRRRHPAAFSSQQDVKKLLQFYEPQTKRRTPLIAWHHLIAHLTAVNRAPVSIGEKIRLHHFLIRDAIRSRGDYWDELTTLVRRNRAAAVPRVNSPHNSPATRLFDREEP